MKTYSFPFAPGDKVQHASLPIAGVVKHISISKNTNGYWIEYMSHQGVVEEIYADADDVKLPFDAPRE